jgi:hypothetical protein
MVSFCLEFFHVGEFDCGFDVGVFLLEIFDFFVKASYDISERRVCWLEPIAAAVVRCDGFYGSCLTSDSLLQSLVLSFEDCYFCLELHVFRTK